MAGRSFLPGQSNDPSDSREGQILLKYKMQLYSMSEFFLYEVDPREVTKRNIDEWVTELRSVVKGIKKLQDIPYIDVLLSSCEGVQNTICKAINNLYVASDILQKRNPSIRDRQKFYQIFTECSALLSDVVDMYFKI